ncbi:hypothetical protein EI162_14550, partial [Psychrobacter sp. FME6]|nr:hypothetical protein [Psychrobacter sp. FME6]
IESLVYQVYLYGFFSIAQTAIGNLFQNIDQTIALQRRKHEQTQTLKKSLLSKMFPQKEQRQPEIRLEGFSGDWVEMTIGSISNVFSGGTPSVCSGIIKLDSF